MYKINEIFYSLQGEGRWTGRPAVFVRMSGCNLKCPFCDTDFQKFREMTAVEIVAECQKLGGECRFIVLTGGEPTLQVDENLVEALHQKGYYLSMETNGTHPIPRGIDWVTCSPKQDFTHGGKLKIKRADELKLVFDAVHPVDDHGLKATYKYLQPCDMGSQVCNEHILLECINYIKLHPEWQLSLQMHKILGIR